MKSFFNKTLNVLSEISGPLCQNCMSSANVVVEFQFNPLNKGALSTGEPCTCKYVTLFQSFHGGTLSIHWYIAQNFEPTFSILIYVLAFFPGNNFQPLNTRSKRHKFIDCLTV